MTKINIETLVAALHTGNAEDQKAANVHNAVKAALAKFEGKEVSRHFCRAIKVANPDWLVNQDNLNTICVWGGNTGLSFDKRASFYLDTTNTFSLARFDGNNAGTGSAAAERIAQRAALLLDRVCLFRLVEAANAVGKSAIATLRISYGGISRVDPETPAMRGTRSAAHHMSDELLRQLVDEKIPWLQTVAATELRERVAKLFNTCPATLGELNAASSAALPYEVRNVINTATE